MNGSVLTKALQVQAEASRLQEGVSAEVETKRVTQRLAGLETQLGQLERILAIARRLNSQQVPVHIDLTGIDAGLDAFRAKALAGPPSNQVFTTAGNKVTTVVDRLTTATSEAWAAWTNRLIAEIPIARISILQAHEQREIRTKFDELKKLAKPMVPSISDVAVFLSTADLIADRLNDLKEPPQEVLDLLKRLDQRPRLTIDQITDEQIRILRTSGIADQIELHRRGI